MNNNRCSSKNISSSEHMKTFDTEVGGELSVISLSTPRAAVPLLGNRISDVDIDEM